MFVVNCAFYAFDSQAIFCAGYKAILHIHAVVEECEIVELTHQIDLKTKKRMKKKPLFVKKGAFVECRVQVLHLYPVSPNYFHVSISSINHVGCFS